jgi:serine/threonine-protein kinase
VADLCRRCLDEDPTRRPTSLVAALLLAEAVDARVYVPMHQPLMPRQRQPSVSPWTDRAAAEVTEAAAEILWSRHG